MRRRGPGAPAWPSPRATTGCCGTRGSAAGAAPPVPPPVLLEEPGVGEDPLRVLVEVLHVGVRRRGVEVEVAFLHVLAVIALGAGETEEPLLHDGIAAIPEGERE